VAEDLFITKKYGKQRNKGGFLEEKEKLTTLVSLSFFMT
jgi:hypothetical protein